MSCQLKHIATVKEIVSKRKFLSPSENEESGLESSGSVEDLFGDATENWSWPVSKIEQDLAKSDSRDSVNKNSVKGSSWLQNCLISVSPRSEVLAIANESKLIVMTGKWDRYNENDQTYYQTVLQSEMDCENRAEITAVLCIPIASTQRSGHGATDWTCIVVGFSTGHVRMYTENGVLLLNQHFHEDRVLHLRCLSSSRFSTEIREVQVVYSKILVSIEGFELIQTLRVCRNQVARAPTAETHFDIPPLSYKKWGLYEQEEISDIQSVGLLTPSNYDHLRTASLCGGFYATYRPNPPVQSLVLGVGTQPYLAMYYASEGVGRLVLSNVAYALASKVKSAVWSAASGWLGFGGSNNANGSGDSAGGLRSPEKTQKSEPASRIDYRFGYSDPLRQGTEMALTRDQRLAAITDSLGRILLLDVRTGFVIRMWKGYRDAECAWVESWDPSRSKPNAEASVEGPSMRAVHFLVIYVSKRGLLEIWTAQQGPRVAAFNVAKGGRLLYSGFQVIDSTVTPYAASSEEEGFACLFLDPEGKMYSITIPFHCALQGISQQKSKELHILEEIKRTLRQDMNTFQSAMVMDLKSACIQSQVMDCVLKNNNLPLSLVVSVLDALISTFQKSENLDPEGRVLQMKCISLRKLCHWYEMLEDLYSRPPDYAAVTATDDTAVLELPSLLKISDQEASIFLTAMKFDRADACVETMPWWEFLRSWRVGDSAASSAIHVETSLTPQNRSRLGRFVYCCCLKSDTAVTQWASAATEINANLEELAMLAVEFWLNGIPLESSGLEISKKVCAATALKFCTMLTSICTFSEAKYGQDNKVSPFWDQVRNSIRKATNLPRAYSLSLICRSVSNSFGDEVVSEKKQKKEEILPDTDLGLDDESFSEWESLSMDAAEWNMIIRQLEDVIALQTFLDYQPQNKREDLKEDFTISLASIIAKGKGSVTELIGRWVAAHNINLIPILSDEVESETSDPNANLEDMNPDDITIIRVLLDSVKARLPCSTRTDVLLISVALEYAAQWNKDLERVQYLQRAIAHVSRVSSAVIRHGITRLLWFMFLGPHLAIVAQLMDKVGRLPKGSNVKRSLGASPEHVLPFLYCVEEILDLCIEAAMALELEAPPTVVYDDLWPREEEGQTPLWEVALRQRLLNIDLALLHQQLVSALILIASLGLKGLNALALFDRKVGRNTLFKELHTHPPLPNFEGDPVSVHNRMQLLEQAIAVSVETAAHELQSASLSKDISRIMKLGREMANVDCDQLRLKYVSELYKYGFDNIAEEVLPSINDVSLGVTLLNIAGGRLKFNLHISTNFAQKLSTLSPEVSLWLQSQDLPIPETPVTVSSVKPLLHHAISRLSNNVDGIAMQLLDAVDEFVK